MIAADVAAVAVTGAAPIRGPHHREDILIARAREMRIFARPEAQVDPTAFTRCGGAPRADCFKMVCETCGRTSPTWESTPRRPRSRIQWCRPTDHLSQARPGGQGGGSKLARAGDACRVARAELLVQRFKSIETEQHTVFVYTNRKNLFLQAYVFCMCQKHLLCLYEDTHTHTHTHTHTLSLFMYKKMSFFPHKKHILGNSNQAMVARLNCF